MNRIIVVKIGGATLGSHDTTIGDVVRLHGSGKSIIVVHGGGKVITEWLAKQGVSTRFVRGRRVTDEVTLEVVISVLAGLVNKEIVAAINSLGGKAIGLSGVDGALVQCRIEDVELGYVGTVARVNPDPLKVLLRAGYVPVISPVSSLLPGESDEAVKIVNVNADTVAGEIAVAVGAEKLIFLTDVAGINDQEGKLLTQISPSQADTLITAGVASGGMIPKIQACLRALASTSVASIIDGRQPHALFRDVEENSGGTTIKGG